MTMEKALYLASTEKSVDETIETLMELVGRTGTPAYMCFGNWDDDSRELYDIPEVQRWCREFIQKGGLSLLEGPQDPICQAMPGILPPQFLVAACAGEQGTRRVSPYEVEYNPVLIQKLVQQNLQ